MARTISKSRRRDDYEREVARADFMVRSYLGGEAYAEGDYLFRHPREKASVHEARKERASYWNYVAAILDNYAAEVFRRDPSREVTGPEGAVSAFVGDCIGDDTPLTAFTRDACISALLANRAYVGVDLDPDALGTPYVYPIHPANLLNYSVDRRGAMRWALVAEEYVDDANPFEDAKREERYRLWLPDEWVLFDKSGSGVESGRNEAGRVPILVLDASDVRLPIYDIAVNNRGLYNLISLLDEQLYGQTFAQFYLSAGDGVEKDGQVLESPEDAEALAEQAALEIGVSRVLLLPQGVTMPPGYAAPPDGPTNTLRQERRERIQAMYSMAGLERRDPDDLKAQSGVAKAYDFKETNARLAALANMAEEFERNLFDLLADYGVMGPANVTYRKEFDVQPFAAQLENHVALLEAPGVPETAKRRSSLDLALRAVDDGTEEEKQRVRQEVEDMNDFGTSEPDPLTRLTQSLGA